MPAGATARSGALAWLLPPVQRTITTPSPEVPMRHSITSCLAGLTLLSAPLGIAAGAEHLHDHAWYTDLRLEGSLLPDTFDVDATANGPVGSLSRSGETEFDDAWRVGIIAQSAHFVHDPGVAFGTGGGIQYSQWRDGGDVDQKLQVLAATLRLGLVIRANEMFHLEALPYGALGVARGEIGNEDSDNAFYWEVGGIAGAFLTFDDLQLGIHAGYLWNGTKLEFDDDANFASPVDGVTVKMRAEGAFVGLSLGSRF
jgi:hypothetical protein